MVVLYVITASGGDYVEVGMPSSPTLAWCYAGAMELVTRN